MNIIYIAYSCSPNNGTEDKLGWNIPLEASRTNKVWIITKPEGKRDIDLVMNNIESSLQIIYVDIPSVYKRIFKGDFYSGRLNVWNKRAKRVVEELCKNNRIDIIHQINPVEFRSIGDFGNTGAKFVCGPLGGGEYMQKEFLKYAKGGRNKEVIRFIANAFYKYKYRITGRIKRIDKLLFANEETRLFLTGSSHTDQYPVCTEIGSTGMKELHHKQSNHKEVLFLSAGRIIYRKGFRLLLAAVSRIQDNRDFKVIVLGDGPKREKLKKIVTQNSFLCNRIQFLGKVPYKEMGKYYDMADYFIMPSLRETTGSVILESLEYGVPVITFFKYGAKNLLNEQNSITCKGKERKPEIELAQAMQEAIDKKGTFDRISVANTVNDFSFKLKVDYYLQIYRGLEKRCE